MVRTVTAVKNVHPFEVPVINVPPLASLQLLRVWDIFVEDNKQLYIDMLVTNRNRIKHGYPDHAILKGELLINTKMHF